MLSSAYNAGKTAAFIEYGLLKHADDGKAPKTEKPEAAESLHMRGTPPEQEYDDMQQPMGQQAESQLPAEQLAQIFQSLPDPNSPMGMEPKTDLMRDPSWSGPANVDAGDALQRESGSPAPNAGGAVF